MKKKIVAKEKLKDENLIHVRLDYQEALDSKRDILSSEICLLKIIKLMKDYRELRNKEMELKMELHKRLRSLIAHMRNCDTQLPNLKIPGMLKKEEIKIETPIRKTSVKKKIVEKTPTDDIEAQLQEIQDRLRSLAA